MTDSSKCILLNNVTCMSIVFLLCFVIIIVNIVSNSKPVKCKFPFLRRSVILSFKIYNGTMKFEEKVLLIYELEDFMIKLEVVLCFHNV